MTEAVPTGRHCGECGLCCELLGVPEIDKGPHVWCDHYAHGTGCTIYEKRPGACRTFSCLWLGNTDLDDSWRPDRARFVLHVREKGRQLGVEVDPSRPDAWKKPQYLKAMQSWAALGRAQGMQVTVFVGRRGFLLDGTMIHDLGESDRKKGPTE